MNTSATRVRLGNLLKQRETLSNMQDELIARIESRRENGDDGQPTEVEKETLKNYRSSAEDLDSEITDLTSVLEREEAAASTSKIVRAHLANDVTVGEMSGGQFQYRSFAQYARDEILRRSADGRISGQLAEDIIGKAGGREEVDRARERLSRAPLHTLSSDVAGLIPAQHISTIMEVINNSRPIVQSARNVDLDRGTLTYPHVDQKPDVLLQGTEKTEGGTQDMQISMATVTAKTFIGGGNLSWQAINWSTPSALDLWFTFAAESYARKTEGTAAAILTACGTANRLGSADRIGTASTFADWLSGVVLGFQEVYENSNAMADTLWLSPDMFFLAAALTSDSGAVLISQGGLTLNTLQGNIAGVRVVTSYGLAANTAIVGDSTAFLVAETPGAPVQLRAVEPSIGGLEVGVIGAFAASCYDSDRFSQIT